VGGTYQRLKDKLQGLGKDVQAVDTSDLEYNSIKASGSWWWWAGSSSSGACGLLCCSSYREATDHSCHDLTPHARSAASPPFLRPQNQLA
jgi:hypothetical protein